jgi:hypothetical protein
MPVNVSSVRAPLIAANRVAPENRDSGSMYISSIGNGLNGTVAVYDGDPPRYVRSFKKGLDVPVWMSFNSRQELFVSNESGNDVTVYKSAGRKPFQTITASLKQPTYLVNSSKNDLYVIERRHVDIFIDGQQNNLKTIRQRASAVAIDSADNAYIAAQGTVYVYAPEATQPSRKITQGVTDPRSLIVDSLGTLYVGNYSTSSCGNVTVYSASTGKLERTVSNGVCGPAYMATDSSGNLYVTNILASNSFGGTVTEYAAGTNSLLETISNGISGPGAIATDASGNLYVANMPNGPRGNVTVYPDGQTTPSETLTQGIGAPTAFALAP